MFSQESLQHLFKLSFCFLKATTLQSLHMARQDQGRPFPWEEHILRLKKMIPQLVLFHVLSEGSLRKKKRGQTVNFSCLCPTWR